MQYDITTSHMNTQHWLVEADSKEHAEEIFKKCKIEWSKELRKYVCRYPIPCLLYTSPSPRDRQKSRMPSSA